MTNNPIEFRLYLHAPVFMRDSLNHQCKRFNVVNVAAYIRIEVARFAACPSGL